MSPSSILSAATNQTPSSHPSFPSLPLTTPWGSRPGVGLLFLGRHKSRHFRLLVCFTGECATRSCSKTLGLFPFHTLHFSFPLPLCLLSLLHFPFLLFPLPPFHHNGIRLLSVEKPVPCYEKTCYLVPYVVFLSFSTLKTNILILFHLYFFASLSMFTCMVIIEVQSATVGLWK